MIDLDQTDLAELEAVLETDKGTMVLSFFADKAPKHVHNFLRLSQEGFYDGLAFHRVVRNFMVQGGCPNTKEGARGTPGTGGPDQRLQAEFNDVLHERGVVSMSRSADVNSAGSQFFIVHAESAEHLDGQYTAFGKVSEGLDVLDEIASVDVDFGPAGERSTPVERIGIRSVEVRVCERPVEVQTPVEGEAQPVGEASTEQIPAEGASVEGPPADEPPVERTPSAEGSGPVIPPMEQEGGGEA